MFSGGVKTLNTSIFFERKIYLVRTSLITGKTYNEDVCVQIMNPTQAGLYIKHNVNLFDIKINEDNKMVFLFDYKASKPFYEKWLRHELV